MISILLDAFEPIVEALLSLWLRHRFFRYRKALKNKSFGVKSGLYGGWLIKSIFWVLKNAVVWADVWELALSWWRVIRLRRLVFLISWKTTGKQMVVYHSKLTVQRWSSGTIVTCPVFPQKNRWSFAWKCFVRDQLLMDLIHLKTAIQLTAVYFRVHTRKSTIHHLSRCHRRVSKHHDRIFGTFFWAIDKLCRI